MLNKNKSRKVPKAFTGFRGTELIDKIIEVYSARMDDLIAAVMMEMGSPRMLAAKAQVPAGLGHFIQIKKVLEGFDFGGELLFLPF